MKRRSLMAGAFVAVALSSGLFGRWTADKPVIRPSPASLVVRLPDAKTYDIPGGVCRLYPDSPTGRLSCAAVESTGRYPETGRKMNRTCTEAIYVIEGELSLSLGEEKKTLSKGDVAYIAPGTPYSIEGKAKVFVFIEPKWDKTQSVAVD